MEGIEGLATIVRFSEFEADLSTRELHKRGLRIGLRKQSFDVLASLLQHPGEVVTRKTLCRRLWPADVFVDFDNNLNAAVARLRAALGDSSKHPRFIETLPALGYRFITPVTSARRSSEPLGARPSVAVLSFRNIGRDLEDEFFSDVLTEEIINALAQVEGLRVVSRTSAFHFKDTTKDIRSVGRELGVGSVVEGIVRRTGKRLRVTARLISVSDGGTLWSERFDRELRYVFDVQDELVRTILIKLQIRLGKWGQSRLVKRATAHPEAHGLYLRGLHLGHRMTPVSFHRAIECLEMAKSIDPDYGEVCGVLAEIYVAQAIMGWTSTRDVQARAEAELSAAFALDDGLVNSHRAQGMMLNWCAWNWEESERAYQRALSLGPGDAFSHFGYSRLLLFTGRLKESLQRIQLGLELDPVSPLVNWQLSWVYLGMGQYDDAIEQDYKILELVPAYLPAYWHLGWAFGEKGLYPEVINACEQGQMLAAGDVACEAILGWLYARAGGRNQALASIARLTRAAGGQSVPVVYVAIVYVGLGDHTAAFQWLEMAYNQREPFLTGLKVAPVWCPLRADPRFHGLLQRIRLEPVGNSREPGAGILSE